MKIADVVIEFEIYLTAIGRSPRTSQSYHDRLAVLPMSDQLESLTPIDLDKIVIALRNKIPYHSHPNRPPKPGRLSPATIYSHVKHLKAFFNWCIQRGYLDRSPAGHLHLSKPQKGPQSRAITPDDLHRLIQAATHPRDNALLKFLCDTGCRAGEAATLQWANLDIVSREALVSGKTGPGIVDFSPQCANALITWQKSCPSKTNVFVSLDAPHRPLTVAGLYQVLRRLAATTGVTGRFNPHAIRHRVATVYAQTVDLETARQKLRHADIATTAQYVHVDRGRLKQLTDTIKID